VQQDCDQARPKRRIGTGGCVIPSDGGCPNDKENAKPASRNRAGAQQAGNVLTPSDGLPRTLAECYRSRRSLVNLAGRGSGCFDYMNWEAYSMTKAGKFIQVLLFAAGLIFVGSLSQAAETKVWRKDASGTSICTKVCPDLTEVCCNCTCKGKAAPRLQQTVPQGTPPSTKY
jgi:hypothetical protein